MSWIWHPYPYKVLAANTNTYVEVVHKSDPFGDEHFGICIGICIGIGSCIGSSSSMPMPMPIIPGIMPIPMPGRPIILSRGPSRDDAHQVYDPTNRGDHTRAGREASGARLPGTESPVVQATTGRRVAAKAVCARGRPQLGCVPVAWRLRPTPTDSSGGADTSRRSLPESTRLHCPLSKSHRRKETFGAARSEAPPNSNGAQTQGVI